MMSDLIASSIWLLGSLTLLVVLATAALVTGKLSRLLTGREVEIDSIFYLVGAFVGMLFLPSGDHPTAESSIALVLAIVFGAFVGGIVGLFTHLWLSRFNSSAPDRSGVTDRRDGPLAIAFRTLGRLAVILLLIAAGAIVVVARLGDIPLLGPVVRFILQRLWNGA